MEKKLLNLAYKYFQNIERKVGDIPLSKQSITRRTEELSLDVSGQVNVLRMLVLSFD